MFYVYVCVYVCVYMHTVHAYIHAPKISILLLTTEAIIQFTFFF